MLPQPITPRVLPVISTPMKRFFSHFPAWVELSAWGIWRASASIKVMACSAVVMELPNGVFITMMPLPVAAGMSTLSTPMAGAADHLRLALPHHVVRRFRYFQIGSFGDGRFGTK